MVMDAVGGVRVSTDRDLLGRNFAFREYFKQAMAGRSFTTGIVVGAAAGAAGVFFAEPVRDGAGAGAGRGGAAREGQRPSAPSWTRCSTTPS
jgi:C4-dicarboxylate-specific signal transduction histidine kinase